MTKYTLKIVDGQITMLTDGGDQTIHSATLTGNAIVGQVPVWDGINLKAKPVTISYVNGMITAVSIGTDTVIDTTEACPA